MYISFIFFYEMFVKLGKFYSVIFSDAFLGKK